jgi:transposase-like protein
MRNALAHVPTGQRTMVAAMLRTIFAQQTKAAAHEQWRRVADGLRERFPKLGALLDRAEDDLLAHMDFPREHWPQLASTNPLERLNAEIKRRTDVVGIFPNDAAIIRLVGALLLEQNDVYGPPPTCKAFGSVMVNPVLAVVYPALECGQSTAGPDGFRGSAARQVGELGARIILWA